MNQVVNIFDGEQRDAFIEESGYGSSLVWWPEHPIHNHMEDGCLYSGDEVEHSRHFAWALYDQEREAHASVVRQEIADLKAQVEEARRRLFALYADKVEVQP